MKISYGILILFLVISGLVVAGCADNSNSINEDDANAGSSNANNQDSASEQLDTVKLLQDSPIEVVIVNEIDEPQYDAWTEKKIELLTQNIGKNVKLYTNNRESEYSGKVMAVNDSYVELEGDFVGYAYISMDSINIISFLEQYSPTS